jgi:hypothetical protein
VSIYCSQQFHERPDGISLHFRGKLLISNSLGNLQISSSITASDLIFAFVPVKIRAPGVV